MISNQSLTCPKGTSLTFEIDMDTGSDLTGATAQWALCESWFDQAKVYLTKTGTGDGLFIGQDAGVWKITVNLAPTDTLDIPSGLLYHDCKVLLQSGDVEDVANGPFSLDPSVNILLTNAPITRNVHAQQALGRLGQTAPLTVSQLTRNLFASQSMFGLGQVTTAAHPGFADWFVDSVAGSDSNSGTAQGTPFATLAAVSTAIVAQPTKTIVALKRGSRFRESLSQAVTSAFDYGNSADALPIVDGSDIITGWTVNGTQAAVWEKTVTIPLGGRPRVFENGSLMKWVADLATCATTAGSRVLIDDGGTVTLQIHPSDGGNPNTNGKTYELTARLSPILLGSNCTLKGIHSQRAISSNGCIEMGMDSYLERCLAVDGSKHNMLVGSGDMVDVIAVRTDDVTPAQPIQSYIVGFGGVNSITGHSLNMVRCGVISDKAGTQLGVAMIDHGGVGDVYTAVSISQCWAVDCQTDFQPSSLTTTIQGYYVENVASFISGYNDSLTVSDAQINLTQTGNLGSGRNITGLGGTLFAHFTDVAIYGLSSLNGLFRQSSSFNGGNLSLTSVAVYSTNPGQIALADTEGWSSGTLNLNGNLLISNNGGSNIQVPSGVTYAGNNNAFGAPLGSSTGANFKWHGGSALTGITSWQTASGQDANSLEFDPSANLFPGAGVANGDFRLGGNIVPTALKGINAGPQNHWDWNARLQVSGAPARWPVIPRTLADAIAYVKDPASWNWGSDSTLSADSTPDAFTFTDVTNAPISTDEISNLITVSGLDVGTSVAVSVTGGQYSKNGGAYTSSAGTAVNGDTFRVKQTSSATNATTTNTVLTIGGVSDTYSVTTLASSGPSPTLSADFLTTSSLPAWMTISRASTGDYHDASGTVQTASNDVPRFDHDATTHVALGLMIMNAGGTQGAADNVQLVGSALSILQGTAYSVVLKITDNAGGFYVNYMSTDGSSGTVQADLLRQFAGSTDKAETMDNETSNTSIQATLGSGTNTGAMKVGLATDGSGRSLVANNGTVVSDALTSSRSLTAAALGCRLSFGAQSQFSNMHLAGIELYNTRISNTDLQAKTA